MISKILFYTGLIFLITAGCARELPETELSALKLEEIADSEDEIVFPFVVEDLLSRKVPFNEFPQRIVSLVPAATEIFFSVDAGVKLVGVTEYCTYPPEAQQKQIVGGYASETISLEKIIYLDPDLVIVGGEYHRTIITALENTGINVFSMEMRTINDVYNTIIFSGHITDNTVKANLRIEYMKEKQDKIGGLVLQIQENSRKTVFWEVWSEPLMTAGGKSFINELIEISGGKNIFSYLNAEYPVISTEDVLYKNPEIIFGTLDNIEALEHIKNRTGWNTISAVQNNKVFLLDENIVSRPGPRIINALGLITKNLYPELFNIYFDKEDPLLW